MRSLAAKEFGVDFTPTFVVVGEVVRGVLLCDTFTAKLMALPRQDLP